MDIYIPESRVLLRDSGFNRKYLVKWLLDLIGFISSQLRRLDKWAGWFLDKFAYNWIVNYITPEFIINEVNEYSAKQRFE